MAQIGLFTRTSDGYAGRIHTLTLDIELVLVLAEGTGAENAPDYRIHIGVDDTGPEIGAAWKRTGERAGDYLSLIIDDPSFVQPIRANLFQAESKAKGFHLLWNRPAKRDDRR